MRLAVLFFVFFSLFCCSFASAGCGCVGLVFALGIRLCSFFFLGGAGCSFSCLGWLFCGSRVLKLGTFCCQISASFQPRAGANTLLLASQHSRGLLSLLFFPLIIFVGTLTSFYKLILDSFPKLPRFRCLVFAIPNRRNHGTHGNHSRVG